MTEINQSAKSQLAKLLATENINVRQSASATTASFDIKNRTLTTPIWKGISVALNDMLLIHETGHALDTPPDGWIDAIKNIAKKVYGDEVKSSHEKAVRGFLNVVEDCRIDRRQKTRYPGSRRDYLIGYKELIDRDFFQLSNRDVNTMAFIDRANVYYKGGAANLDISFSPKEKALLRKLDSTETFDDVVALTEELFVMAKDEQSEGGSGVEYSEEDSDEYGDGDWSSVDDDFDDSEESDSDGDSRDVDSDKESDSDESKPNNGAGSGEDIPHSETDEAWEKSKESLAGGDGTEYVYVNMPEANLAAIVDDFKVVLAQWRQADLSNARSRFHRWKTSENATISYMVKEFEMRKAADEYARTSISKTGMLDTNAIHTYKFNDDLFLKTTTIAQGKNHGFVLFLDWSGSMCSNIDQTLKQLFALTLFCNRVQIPFEVYLFRDISGGDNYKGLSFDSKNQDNVLKFANFKLRNILSSRMNSSEINDAYAYLLEYAASSWIDYMNGTPLNEAIFVAPLIVKEFQRRNKIQIVSTIFLTDGDSNPTSLGNAKYNRGFDAANKRYYTHKFIIQCPVSKKEYYLSHTGGRELTSALLRMLKSKCDCNLVGFYINSYSFNAIKSRYFAGLYNLTKEKELKTMWEDENFCPVSSEGYDEYYLVKFDQSNLPTKFTIADGASTKKIATAFSKFSAKKATSRVLLSRFIKRIATFG